MRKELLTFGAVLALFCLALIPAEGQAYGMTGLPVMALGSIAPAPQPNEAQLLTLEAARQNHKALGGMSQPRKTLVISAFGGEISEGHGADDLFNAYGEEKSFGRTMSRIPPSDRSVMETPTQAQNAVYWSSSRM